MNLQPMVGMRLVPGGGSRGLQVHWSAEEGREPVETPLPCGPAASQASPSVGQFRPNIARVQVEESLKGYFGCCGRFTLFCQKAIFVTSLHTFFRSFSGLKTTVECVFQQLDRFNVNGLTQCQIFK